MPATPDDVAPFVMQLITATVAAGQEHAEPSVEDIIAVIHTQRKEAPGCKV